ncbi:histidine phosphatase family protein [Paenibacillus kobensis]|uniref:histidine phosphatase family protein n=1 Tax=Paenibacillus kobensis TaxID=59841 RepID=UPI000FD9A90E|nr:histidine phosphatase family protein [Paenibacillus kobensis]
MTTTIYLTRHGETQWNIEHRMQGHLDSPLTDKGRRQAQSLGERLSDTHFAAVYTSSSPRAATTAELIISGRDIAIHKSDALREIHMGEWEGRSDVREAFPEDDVLFWERPHLYVPNNGGEGFQDVLNRAVPFMQTIAARHAGEEILVVSHTVTLKLLMSHYEARPMEKLWEPPFVHPTSLSKIIVSSSGARIEYYADMSHSKE